jgi:7,8-dihydroneopterin aldolase/epimerase/oxygenase
MVTVQLTDLRFFAHHGVFEGEKETGSEFEIQLKVKYEPPSPKFGSLQDVIDYEGSCEAG